MADAAHATPATRGRGRGVLALAVVIGLLAFVPMPTRAAEHPRVEVLFDGTQESFDRWRHVGGGSFELRPDGSMRTIGGLGMLWYPAREYTDFVLRFEWRDVSDDGVGNGGVFIRFPDPEESAAAPVLEQHPCQAGIGQAGPAWVAIACGHEIQINDWQDSDGQKTGSVYNFSPNDDAAARRTDKGTWNAYEIRVEGAGDYTVTVTRNGTVIKEWRNSPGQVSSRPTDPPTDFRQFPAGFLGLQNHGADDVIDYRNVTVEDLTVPVDPAPPAPDGDGLPGPPESLPDTGAALASLGALAVLVGQVLRRRP
ncbi:MAG: DUF1080 domain-containing protein [Nitriliruptorales bacterium]|nr:DUF1080 domain-containing protein [Nitriliruptorales bacterium]